MSLRTLALAGALAALAPVLAGCAEDDFEREAAYPQAIGYTAPRPGPPAVQVAQSTTPGVQPTVEGAPAPADSAITVQQSDDDYADTDPSALTDFRSTLDPYGSWVDDPTYGTAWVPSESVVGSDFSPYVSAGHWDYDDDYTWVSDYDWGWAPFHYGRWAYAAPYGWEWIPGRVYAGAWVSWRYGWGDWGYVGWAPIGPTWGWRGGVAYGLGFVPVAPYGFCATGDLFNGHPQPHMVAGSQVGAIASHTQPYSPANPGVNGHTGATPRVNGPPPQILHIPASAVAHGGNLNRGVQQAQAFAHASTATSMGARPPVALASRSPSATPFSASAGRMPSYGPPAPSHFGGKLGSGFRGDIASSRPIWGGSISGTRGYSGYSGSTRPGYSGYSGVRPGSYGSYAPSYRGGFSGYSGGGFHGSPGVVSSSPGRRGGGSSGGEGYSGVPHGFSGGGGSHGGSGFSGFSGGGGFHGGGFSGGGGFHGGGGGGGRGGHR